MKYAILKVRPKVLVDVLKGKVVGNALPDDAEIVFCSYSTVSSTVVFLIKSEAFEDIPTEGEFPILMSPVLEVTS